MTQIVEEEYQCVTCYLCAVKFWMPHELFVVAKQRADDMEFWCPNGHSQVFGREERPTAEIVKFEVVK